MEGERLPASPLFHSEDVFLMIEVRFFATLRENRGKIAEVPAEEVDQAGDILRRFDIPAEEVAILLINGFHSKPDAPVHDGDVVSLFPPVGGG